MMPEPKYKTQEVRLCRWYPKGFWVPVNAHVFRMDRWRRLRSAWWWLCRLGRRVAPWNYRHVDDIDYDD